MTEEELIDYIKTEFDKYLAMIKIKKTPKILRTNELWIPANNTFVSLIGASCSGKSTFVSQHFKVINGISMSKFDADNLPFEIASFSNPADWSREELTAYFLRRLEQILRRKSDLTIVENNNITVDMRARILNRMHSLYNNSVLIGLNPRWEVIEAQFKLRGSEISEKEVFEQIMLDVQFSDPEKYFIGYDKVLITDEPRKASVQIRKSR